MQKTNYYYAVDPTGIHFGGFRPFGGSAPTIGSRVEAPDWDPDPTRECGGGLHIVANNRFIALRHCYRPGATFVRVLPEELLPENNSKHRCRALVVLEVIPWSLNLSGADLRRVDLHWANLRGANLSEADLSEADLSKANLSGANLCFANLLGTDLHGADLSEANLCEADLRRADLRGIDLRGANLRGADLCDADLRGARMLIGQI